MKRIIVFSILDFLFAAFCFAQSDQTESLTITAYYPSPYGIYQSLKLNPTDAVPVAPTLAPGVIYYNNREALRKEVEILKAEN